MNREQRRHPERFGLPPNGMPPQGPQQVALPFQPLPVATNVGTAQTSDGPRVWLQVQTPAGITGIYMSPEHAEQVAKELALAARTSKSGLVIAGNGALSAPDVELDDEEPVLGERPPLGELEEKIGLDHVDEAELDHHDDGVLGGEGGPGGGA